MNDFMMQQAYQQYIFYLHNEIQNLRHGQQPTPAAAQVQVPAMPNPVLGQMPMQLLQLQQQQIQQQQLQQQQQMQLQQQQQPSPTSPPVMVPQTGISPPSTAPTALRMSGSVPMPTHPSAFNPASPPGVGGVLSPSNTPMPMPMSTMLGSPVHMHMQVPSPRMAVSSSLKGSAGMPPVLSLTPTSHTFSPSSSSSPGKRAPTQKPMKFHLVQYSKSPPDELDLRVPGLRTSSDPSTQHQSSTISKLQIHPELLTMKQSDAARILGISPSMLSKRWREAMNGRKWPYRVHRKMQVRIHTVCYVIALLLYSCQHA